MTADTPTAEELQDFRESRDLARILQGFLALRHLSPLMPEDIPALTLLGLVFTEAHRDHNAGNRPLRDQDWLRWLARGAERAVRDYPDEFRLVDDDQVAANIGANALNLWMEKVLEGAMADGNRFIGEHRSQSQCQEFVDSRNGRLYLLTLDLAFVCGLTDGVRSLRHFRSAIGSVAAKTKRGRREIGSQILSGLWMELNDPERRDRLTLLYQCAGGELALCIGPLMKLARMGSPPQSERKKVRPLESVDEPAVVDGEPLAELVRRHGEFLVRRATREYRELHRNDPGLVAALERLYHPDGPPGSRRELASKAGVTVEALRHAERRALDGLLAKILDLRQEKLP